MNTEIEVEYIEYKGFIIIGSPQLPGKNYVISQDAEPEPIKVGIAASASEAKYMVDDILYVRQLMGVL